MMMMKMVSEVAGSLLNCGSVVVLLVAKGFVRLPRPRILSRGRLALDGRVSGIPAGPVSSRGEVVTRTG